MRKDLLIACGKQIRRERFLLKQVEPAVAVEDKMVGGVCPGGLGGHAHRDT